MNSPEAKVAKEPGLSVRPGWVDIGGGLALAFVAALFLWEALSLPPSYNPADVGPGTFPEIAAGVTGILSLAMVASGISLLTSNRTEREPAFVGHPLRVAALMVLMVVYVLSMPIVGVYITTALFVGLSIFLCGGRGLLQLGLPLVLILLFLWIGFDTALNVVFPVGWLR